MNHFGMNLHSRRWIGLLAAVSMHMPAAADQPISAQSADALIAEAVRYEYGKNIAIDPQRAAKLYCAAALLGSPKAAYRLGSMYANGRGVELDHSHAVALYQRAAAQGNKYAKRMLQMIRSEKPVLPDCLTTPVSALSVRTDLATTENQAPAESAKAEAAKAVLAKTERLA